MAKVTYEMDGESTPIVRAWQNVNDAIQYMIRTTSNIAPATNKADQAQKSLGATATRWLNQIESPFQQHLRRLGELQDLRNANLISEKQYADGIALSVNQMKQAEAAQDTLGQAAKRVLAEQVTAQDVFNAKLEELNLLRKENRLTEEQYATAVQKAQHALDAQDVELQALLNDAAKIRQSMIKPQDEYAAALRRANQLLQAGEISEAEYAHAVDQAKEALDRQDESLQRSLRDAAKIKQAAVTPQQQYAEAIKNADTLLKKKLITQKEYDAELRRQNELLQQAQREQEGLSDSSTNGINQMLNALGGVGTEVAGLAGAAMLLKTEYQELRDAQKTAAERQLDTAASQRQAIFALGDDPTMSPQQMQEQAEMIAVKNGVQVKQVLDGVANALSSKAALTAADALSAIDTATEALPFEGATETAGSLLDMKNVFGGTHRELMGLSLGTQQASRVKDSASFMKNAVPSIVNVGRYGDSAVQASTLVAALSTAMTDLEGRSSGTAAEQLAKQLEVALPEAKTGLKTTTDRIKYLQSEEGAKDRVKLIGDGKGKKGSLHVESGAYKAVQELLSAGENSTKANYEAAAAAVPKMDQAEAYYQKALDRVNSQALQIQSAIDRQNKVAKDLAALNDTEGGRAAIARQGLDDALKQSGDSWASRFVTARQMDYAEFTGSEDPQQFAARKMRERAQALRNNVEGHWNEETESIDLSVSGRSRKTADVLEQTAATTDRLTPLLQQIEHNTRKPPPVKQVRQANQPAKPRPNEANAAPGGR